MTGVPPLPLRGVLVVRERSLSLEVQFSAYHVVMEVGDSSLHSSCSSFLFKLGDKVTGVEHESLPRKRLRESDRTLSKLLTILYAVAKERENVGQQSLVLEGRTKSSSSLRASSR